MEGEFSAQGGETKNAATPPPPAPVQYPEESAIELRRDRLLAGLTLMGGVALVLALPFALQAGSEFFLPLTAALVIAVALVPLLEWLERHRVPAPLASLICVVLFIVAVNAALALIVVPAWQWMRMLPDRVDLIQANLRPLIDFYSSLQQFIDDTLRNFVSGPIQEPVAVSGPPPQSLVDLVTSSAPNVLIQLFFAVLVIYFFLSGWTRLRKKAITSRSSFGGAMATARVIQDVVDDTSAYLGTITLINLLLGLFVAGCLWLLGMPTPLMWGGIATLLNYIPYFGPVLAAILLGLGGLMTFPDLWLAALPGLIMIGAHLVEANLITPLVVGHRLTISPLMILVSLSFWSWVWGTPGALLAVPLLIIIQTVMEAAGTPDIAGFLFEHGTLVHDNGGRRKQRGAGDEHSG